MHLGILSGFVAGCFLISLLATGGVLLWLRRRGILDRPNQRSSHTLPTPRGGGLAVIPVLCIGWLVLISLGLASLKPLGIVIATIILAFISWRDDRHTMPILPRFAAQMLTVVIGTLLLPRPGFVFQGLVPIWIDLCLTAFIWLWFVNLYNFMDGIDGISSVETITVSLGVAGVTVLAGQSEDGLMPLALVVAAAMAGFLPWNWHPARIFLGDTGSIPLGYCIGWLLLALASRGLWAPALILPLYYLVDSSTTLLRRGVSGKAIWRAHREHFYQRAVQAGRSHAWVSGQVLGANILLILLAILGLRWPLVATALALLTAIALLIRLTSDRHGGILARAARP